MFNFHLSIGQEYTNDKMYDLIILGGGPAGLTAGMYAARYKLDVLLIEKLFLTGGQVATTQWVENYPGYVEPILGKTLAQNMEEQAKLFGLQIMNAQVDSVSLLSSIKEVILSGKPYKARTILIATGASPRNLGAKGEDLYAGQGISYCATCDGPFYPNKTIAVVGGGNSALEETQFLAKYASKIYLIHRQDKFKADPIIVEKTLQIPHIEVIYNTIIDEIDFSDPQNKTLILHKKDANIKQGLIVDGLFIFVGLNPNSSLFTEQIALENGYITVDTTMQTNIAGVYAAGDIVNKPLRQVATAVGDGATAAYYIYQYLHN